VWGEDAWCYVANKEKLIAEAARLVRPAGMIAFSDWVEGPKALSDPEAERFLRMMHFANVADISDYDRLLKQNRCEVRAAEDTGRLGEHFELFLDMIGMQLTYDVLATVGFRKELLKPITDNFRFLAALARAGKIIQARFVARRQE
jgi:sarcosine/dimethylglycine N-methyltransferase